MDAVVAPVVMLLPAVPILPDPALRVSVGVVTEPVDCVIVPVPVAVKVTDVVPVTLAFKAIASLVPVPRNVSSSPLINPATVIVPLLLVLVRVKSLTVEAPTLTAAALSVTDKLPLVLAMSDDAAVDTL